MVRKNVRRAEKGRGDGPGGIRRDRKGRFKVGLDFDSTCMAVYGKQEGADRGRHPRKKDKPGFQPKFAFLSGLDATIHHRLYPESAGLNSGFPEFYRGAKGRLPRRTVLQWVRGDCALYSKENVKMLEGEGLTFGISAQKTPHMKAAIGRLPEEAWQEFQDQQGRPVELAELYYRPATWPGPKRVFILSRRLKESPQKKLWDEEKYQIYAYLTNASGSLWERYKFCVGRCTVEKCIRESKLGFDWHHLPCAEWDANRAYLGHVQLAYNLMISFKLTALGGAARRWSAPCLAQAAADGAGSDQSPQSRHHSYAILVATSPPYSICEQAAYRFQDLRSRPAARKGRGRGRKTGQSAPQTGKLRRKMASGPAHRLLEPHRLRIRSADAALRPADHSKNSLTPSHPPIHLRYP